MNLRDRWNTIRLNLNPAVIRLLPLIALLIFSLMVATGLFSHAAKPVERSHVISYIPGPFDIPVLGNPQGHFGPFTWRNQIIVLNVFASWCVPCAQEHETLMRLAKTGKVAIYGIAWKDEPAKTLAWITQHGNPYQMIGSDTQGKSTLQLAISGVPETFVIGRDGKIAYNYKAAVTDEMVDNDILPLVERLQTNVPAR